MTNAVKLPGTLKAAQLVIMIEVAFGLAGLAVAVAGFFSPLIGATCLR